MLYTCFYKSPLGGITMASDGTALTGLWFDGQKYFAEGIEPDAEEKKLPVFDETVRWLDIYFGGRRPDFTPPLNLEGTAFRKEVCIIVPCHRVVGTGGSLTGYAGGLAKKLALLKLEGIDTAKFTMPTKGIAL